MTKRMARLQIEITTPERTVFKDTVDSATIPTQEGEITVLPHHIPLVAALAPGVMILRKRGEESFLAVSTGFLHVEDGMHLLILADTAERAEELDMKKIEEARERARQALTERAHREQEAFAEAAATLERELARIKVVRRHRSRGTPVIHQED